jgi:2'-5' RNA ligase
MNSNQYEKTQRLFFALWPDEAVRARIDAMAAGLPVRAGRRVPRDNLHITLVFLGGVAESARRCAEAVADGVRARPFSLSLDQLGHWPRPRVVWVGASTMPDKLARLESALRQGVTQCGIDVDDRPFAPHMTLFRKVSRAGRMAVAEPIEWRVDHFVLVESVTNADGAVYRVLRRWNLVV